MLDVERIDELNGEAFLAAIRPLQHRVTDWYSRLEDYSDDDVTAVFALDLERVDVALAMKASLAKPSDIVKFVARVEVACGPVAGELAEQTAARMGVTAETVDMANPSILALELAFVEVMRDSAYRVTARTLFNAVEAAQKQVAIVHKLLRGDPVIGVRRKLQSSAEYRLQKRGEANLREATARLTQRFYEQPELLPSGMKDPDED